MSSELGPIPDTPKAPTTKTCAGFPSGLRPGPTPDKRLRRARRRGSSPPPDAVRKSGAECSPRE
eukprot:11531623-Alexandrium_andersonii.AAC.1